MTVGDSYLCTPGTKKCVCGGREGAAPPGWPFLGEIWRKFWGPVEVFLKGKIGTPKQHEITPSLYQNQKFTPAAPISPFNSKKVHPAKRTFLASGLFWSFLAGRC